MIKLGGLVSGTGMKTTKAVKGGVSPTAGNSIKLSEIMSETKVERVLKAVREGRGWITDDYVLDNPHVSLTDGEKASVLMKLAKEGRLVDADKLDGREVQLEDFGESQMMTVEDVVKKYHELVKGTSDTIDEASYKPKFKVDDVVYNTRTKTIGIVRLPDDKYGEVKTDADGNVDVDELEYYNPMKHKHHDKAKIAPSTKKEIEKRSLWKPFQSHHESENEAKVDPNYVRKSAPGYVGPKFAKKASDEDIIKMVELKDAQARIHNMYLKPLYDEMAKLRRKYKIKSNHNGLEESVLTEENLSLSSISNKIRQDWKNMSPHAKPYVDAMATLDSINDRYFMDSGRSIVAYFLANAGTWRGPVAKNIKAILKKMLK